MPRHPSIERGRTARKQYGARLPWCVLSMLLTASSAAFADRNYRVAAGDDCSTIAEHELGARRYVGALHRSNPQLGPEPHQLRVGDVLRLPEAPIVVGSLRDVVGDVTVQTPLDTTARPGADAVAIASGTLVTTGNEGSVVFQYSSGRGAAFRIGANARVRINAAAEGVNIERGRLTAAAPRSAAFVVTSKWARVKGSGLVVVSNEGTAISNHGAAAIAVELLYEQFHQPTPLVVQPGFGVYAGTVVGGAKPQVERLPAPTTWGEANRVVLSDDAGASVPFAWGRNATEYGGYLLQLTAPETGAITLVATGSTQASTSLTLQPGRYLSAVSTFSPKHLESTPTTQVSTTVSRIDAPWLPRDPTLPLQARLPLGARIKLPSLGCDVLIEAKVSSNAEQPVFADANWAPTAGSGGGRSWLVSEVGEHLLRCGEQTMRFNVPAVTATPINFESETTEQCIRIDLAGPLLGDAQLVGNAGVDVLSQSYGDGDTGFQTEETGCINFRPVHAKTQQRSISAKIRVHDSTKSAQLNVMLEGSIELAAVAIVPRARVDANMFPAGSIAGVALRNQIDACELQNTPCPSQQIFTSMQKLNPPAPPLPRFELALGATTMTNGDVGAALHFGVRLPRRERLWLEADAQLQRSRTTPATVDETRTNAHLSMNADVWRLTSTLTLRALLGFGASAAPHGNGNIEGVAGASLRWQLAPHAGLRFDARAVLRDATWNPSMAQFGAALYTTFGD